LRGTDPIRQLVVSGYPSNCDRQLLTHKKDIFNSEDGRLYYDIDVDYGQSGCPLYLKNENKIELVGIHIGFSPADNINAGVLINNSVIEVIKKWALSMQASIKMLNSKE